MFSSSAIRRSGWIVPSDVVTDPDRRRLFAALRAQTKAQLVYAGMAADLAEDWVAAWEGSSNMGAERHSLDFWERGRRWATDASEAGCKPPSIER